MLGSPGGTVHAPVSIDNAAGLQSVDLTISYDTNLLDLSDSDVTLGALLSPDWELVVNVTDASGLARISAFGLEPLGGGGGTLLDLAFHVPWSVSTGVSVLGISGRLNEGRIGMSVSNGSISIGVTGTSGGDTYYVQRSTSGVNLEVYTSDPPVGSPAYWGPIASLTSLTINTGNGNDRVIVDWVNGVPIPTGGIFYNGGAQTSSPGDTLKVLGAGAASAAYTPSGSTAGSGVIAIGSRAINFTGLEPLDASGFASFSLVTPNSQDTLYIDTPAAGKNRISGSSGGVPFEECCFYNVTDLILDTGSNDGGGGDDNIVISGDGMTAAGLDRLIVMAGTGDNTLRINGGSVNLDTSPGSGGVNLTVRVENSAVVNLPTTQRLGELIINLGRVNLTAGGAKVLRTSGLEIGPGGKLDLYDNDMIIDYPETPDHGEARLAQITALIASGLNMPDGYWDGAGINSSTAAGDPEMLTGLGMVNNDLGDGSEVVTVFSGQNVEHNTILIKYTYYGDNDLSGSVELPNDFSLFVDGFNSHGEKKGWLWGDYSYDGMIDLDTDFSLFVSAYNNQGAPLSGGGAVGGLFNSATPIRAKAPKADAAAPVTTAAKKTAKGRHVAGRSHHRAGRHSSQRVSHLAGGSWVGV
jgi:hypothetical protein